MRTYSAFRPAASMALAALLAAAPAALAQEREIGTTTAVNPSATGFPPISPQRELAIGTDVVSDERVVTTTQGQAHMLFLDGSALTIGVNSEVVLDTFVYDPDTKTGELVFSATKGLFRMVGGRISKKTQIVFKTPTATIGIRGGVVIIKLLENGELDATFLFGKEMTVANEMGRRIVRRPGFGVSVANSRSAPAAPRLALGTALNQALDGLEGYAGASGGAEDVPGVPEVEAVGAQVIALGSARDPDEEEPPAEEDLTFFGHEGCPPGANTADTASLEDCMPLSEASFLERSNVPSDLTINDVMVVEGQTAIFTVMSDGPVSSEVVVNFATADGSAIAGGPGFGDNDYGAALGTVTIPLGQSSATISVAIIDDNISEGAESFFVNLGAVTSGFATIVDGQGVGTIGAAAVATLSINDVAIGEGETATFIVSASNPADAEMMVTFESAPGSAIAGGGGVAENDFASPGTVTIPVGATSATISITTIDDNVFEGNETFFVNLSDPVNAAIADGQGVGTIVDDESQPAASIADVSVAEGQPAAFVVSVSGPSDEDLVVSFGTADGSAIAGGAGVAENDYGPNAGTVTIPAGQTSVAITVPTIDESVFEGTEFFLVNLTGITGPATIADGQGEGTILDNQTQPTISVGDAAANEGDAAVFTVTLSNVAAVDVTVGLDTADGSAIAAGAGIAENDYGATMTMVTIPAGQISATVGVPTIDENVFEGNETFLVNLTGVTGPATIADGQGLGTIVDNQTLPALSVGNVVVAEGGTAVFTVSLSNASTQPVSVAVATANGTAIAGGVVFGENDYSATGGTFVIPAGQTTVTVMVSTIDEGLVIEGNENFFVNLASPTNATIADGQGIGTILPALSAASGFVGRGKFGATIALGTNDVSSGQNLGLSPIFIESDFLQAATPAGNYVLPYPGVPGPFVVTSGVTPFGPASGTGRITDDAEFVTYELTGSRQLVFAGVPTTTFPADAITSYALEPDFPLSSEVPFVPNASGGALSPTTDPNVFVVWDSTPVTDEQQAFGGGLVFIDGAGATQQSAMSVLVGEVLDTAIFGGPFIQGLMRGTSRLVDTAQAHFFHSDVASSDAGDGSDFFGGSAPDHFVLEAAEVSAIDIILSRGAVETFQEADSADYFPNVVANAAVVPGVGDVRSTRTLNGFVGGMVQLTDGAVINATRRIDSADSGAVSIVTFAALNTVDATFTFSDFPVEDDYTIDFGDITTTGNSFFVDNDILGARERSATVDTFTVTEAEFGMITHFPLQHDGFVPAGVTFCDCDFLEWGFWGGRIALSDGTERQIDLATWVAGVDPKFPSQFLIAGTATYDGHLIGTVNNDGSVYQAVGDMALKFTFASGAVAIRVIDVTVDDFDGTDFTSTLPAVPNVFTTNAYDNGGLTIAGTHPAAGAVNMFVEGKFFGPVGVPPAETGGNFTVTGTDYGASGIYAAKEVLFVPPIP